MDELRFTHHETDCELVVDDCNEWFRYEYEVTCPGIAEPVTLLDGSRSEIACPWSRHEVVLERFLVDYPSPVWCTDVPAAQVRVLVVRYPD